MPLKLNVGLSRKIGEANYGSRGASVNLELELDSAIVGEPERLQDRIRQMFQLAKQSIDEELHIAADSPSASPSPSNTNGAADSNRQHAPPRSSANGDGHGRGTQRGGTIPSATASQVRALHAIAKRQRLNLEGVVRDQFGVDDPAALTIAQASELIDELNGNTAAAGGTRR